MEEHAVAGLANWESFYVIIGSSAAALTGLQFVVIALVAERRGMGTARETAAFATPTVVHFGAVLLLSAFLSAPWHNLRGAGVLVSVVGVAGVIYVLLTLKRALNLTAYRPVMEDWIWHEILPLLAYANLIAQGFAMRSNAGLPLFLIGASALLLLFIGIHNSWDTATYLVNERPPAADKKTSEPPTLP